jgi:hypothetical protein
MNRAPGFFCARSYGSSGVPHNSVLARKLRLEVEWKVFGFDNFEYLKS